MDKKPAPVKFSDSEKDAIRDAARAVWNEVAYDVMTMVAEEGKDSIPRSHVIELALDADRPDHFLRAAAKRNPERFGADFFDRYAKASYKALIAIVKPAFPFARYGM